MLESAGLGVWSQVPLMADMLCGLGVALLHFQPEGFQERMDTQVAITGQQTYHSRSWLLSRVLHSDHQPET